MPPVANVIESAFSPLITLFEEIMVFIHEHIFTSSWGMAIVGLTILVRAVLVPLTFRQLKSMQEMQRLAPQISALKEKYKEDKQRQQQELMKFYQENKINPLASCLPLLLQLPVFVSLFYMLRTDLKKHICGDQLVEYFNRHPAEAAKYHAGVHAANFTQLPTKFVEATGCQKVYPGSAKFLFIPDITSKATGIALIVLITLYVGSQLASTLIATATADANQRRLMLLLPVVFVVILYRYPAGLLVYWITTNLWTIGQQYLIKRHLGPVVKPDSQAPPGSENGKAGKKTLAPPKPEPVAAAAATSTSGAAPSAGSAPPPRPPRKKKKRSGRRR
jgi:YidC/Oxa1 family membrane protein insertase